MAFAERFEDLEIWKAARILALKVYQSVGLGTPAHRDTRFVSQITSAAVSVSNNIAEGFECESAKEFARFLIIAKRSCGEVRSMLWLAEDLSYLSKETAEALRNEAEIVSKRIAAFVRKLG